MVKVGKEEEPEEGENSTREGGPTGADAPGASWTTIRSL